MRRQTRTVIRVIAATLALLASFASSVSAQDGALRRVSIASSGEEARGPSYSASVDHFGRFVAFDSDAPNLVDKDANRASDVFIHKVRTGVTRRVSLGANKGSFDPSLSRNGRFVAFESEATSLVRRDGNQAADIFVRDRKRRVTKLISTGAGRRGNGGSYEPSMSADASGVAFSSYASNLVPGDTNNDSDIFVRNLVTRRTRRASLTSRSRQANEGSYSPAISGDGRFVAFDSLASNLVRRDGNDSFDVFLRDLRNKTTRRISVGARKVEGNSNSFAPAISNNGRVIAFWSRASNLTKDDTDDGPDVFVRDLRTGTTERVSVGIYGNGASFQPSISADGRFVAFFSLGRLVREDTNDEADVYVFDRVTRTLAIASSGPGGIATDGASLRPALSGDGSAVAFHSFASNLVDTDTNGKPDIFVRFFE